MKLFLTDSEKKDLRNNRKITIERFASIGAPESSIIHGKGDGVIFDKVDYRWVYGNTSDYIKKMKNVGRRKVDYKNNKPNTWNGHTWWEFGNKTVNEWNKIGETITSGKISYSIVDMHVSELREKGQYQNVVIKLTVKSLFN